MSLTSDELKNPSEGFTKDEVIAIAADKPRKENDDLELLEKRKRHQETQKQLEAQKKICNEKLEELRQRRAYLDEQKAKFKQQQQEYAQITAAQHKIAMESEKGRGQVRNRAVAGMTKPVSVEESIIERRKELEDLRHQQMILNASVERYRVYKDFLEQLEERSSEGSTIDEIMSRFHTLTSTYESIKLQIDNLRATKEEMARSHAETMKAQQSLLLQETTETEQKQNLLKDLRMKVKKLENSLYSMDDHTVQQKELKSALSMAVRNLHDQLISGYTAIFRRDKTASGTSGGGGAGGGAGLGSVGSSSSSIIGIGAGGGSGGGGIGAAGEGREGASGSSNASLASSSIVDASALTSATLSAMLKDIQSKMEDLQFIIDNRLPQYADLNSLCLSTPSSRVHSTTTSPIPSSTSGGSSSSRSPSPLSLISSG
ncbi:uncharacterized protein MONOS_6651 [Monocercomonoides exilis]|uniref:uncharacterized protein n=1 Tax=Monocercomonoides exilis TaxID=2049356 RepID=UPI003559372F|nr:hypothetical protein MONOS_6651 [Monocercomonoides exilis]|eukprot:MONOS_6651.1-p1 / transcript=MONOS_6651.1 / gene=MONOS_6651 / organism=Monocercomonoides_exilis_PA203 / gene_product=unspecified product / transcript_product=unspecified product / location=Mono_scaffold00213:50910-52500(-) / protein_length=430 / sequence_SO=supercontig / SO=protein_coding / is_pseudo=false